MTPQAILTQVQPNQPSPLPNGLAAYQENGSEDGRYVSEEEYWAVYYENSDFHYEQMIDAPVYQGFVSPFLRAERLRAEEERQRADAATQRAERYAAMLKAMGISLDDEPTVQ